MNIVKFVFDAGQDNPVDIRAIQNELTGDNWFVLKDALEAMASTTTTTAAIESINQGLGDGFVGNTPVHDARGCLRDTTIVAEAALYYLLLRSAKGRAGKTVTAIISQVKDLSSVLTALNEFEAPEECSGMYVYAIREGSSARGAIKLGISRDPEKRLKDLQTGNSNKLHLIAVKPVSSFKEELVVHKEAKNMRIRGEWFRPEAISAMEVAR